MSGAENKAVFLSYASQDVDAARRICESLRAAEGGLEHGDEWDSRFARGFGFGVLGLGLKTEWGVACER